MQYTVLEIQFRFLKFTVVTRIGKKFEQLFFEQGDYTV